MTWALFWQLAASAVTIWSMWQMGNRRLSGPAWGLFGQLVWLVMMITSEAWGLLPVNAAMWFVHARNLRKWMREGSA